MFGMSPKRRFGLFGGAPDYTTPPYVPPPPTMQAAPPPPQAPQQESPQSFWEGGDKFRGRDAIAAALAAISDVAYQRSGIRGGATEMLTGGRLSAIEAARKAQAAAAARQQERQEGLHDYEAKKGIDQRYATPTGDEYTYFEDNAGNRWRQNKVTGAVDSNPTFIDKAPKQYMQDGMLINVPNPYMTGAAPQGTPPPISSDDWERGIPLGGGAGSNAGSNFRNAFAGY